MAWIDEALPMPPARPVEADEALDAGASALVAITASVATMQLFMAFVLERPAETMLYAAGALVTGAAGFVPSQSRSRRGALIASASAGVVVWLAMLPLSREGATTAVVLGLAAACALLARRLIGGGDEAAAYAADRSPGEEAVGWIEEDVEGAPAV